MRWAATIGLVECSSIAVSTARLWFVIHALGHQPRVTAAVVLTLAGIIASASGILRGGLGLRELLAGAFAPLVGLPISLGFLAAAIDRIIGIIGHVPLAIVLSRGRPSEHAT
jgi:uncharacterized membrane protein YbhN (UPF0104 family)